MPGKLKNILVNFISEDSSMSKKHKNHKKESVSYIDLRQTKRTNSSARGFRTTEQK